MKFAHFVLVFMMLFSGAVTAADDRSLETRRGHVVTALQTEIIKRQGSDIYGPGPLAEAILALQKCSIYKSSWFTPEPEIEKAISAAEAAVARIGQPPTEQPRKGFQERAYLSEIDASPQPYVLYVPTAYDARDEWPLLVFLHGYHPDLDVTNWIEYMYPRVLQETCEELGVILLVPYGRSNTEFMGIGEADVLQTLQYVRDEYQIDADRIFLSGVSMGGSGAYTIACHHPDLFAGVAAFTGRVDYYSWMNVPRESLPPHKQVQIDTDYAMELLPNLLHVPVLIFHGEKDLTMPPSQSRLMHQLLRERGQASSYYEVHDADHYSLWQAEFMAHPELIRMLKESRRDPIPAKVTFRTYTLKYPGAYWVKIDRISKWGKPAYIEAQCADGKLLIKAENVARLTLGPDFPDGFDPKKTPVLVNGAEWKLEHEDNGRFLLNIAAYQRPLLPKTSLLCGPIREAWAGPFVIVYPSEITDEAVHDSQAAQRLAREWFSYSQGRALCLPDNKVSDDIIKTRNLIVVGSPATNSLLARIADRLPIQITDNSYIIGDHEFPREGNGLQFIYPNPLSPGRYVLVIDGTQWGPELQINHKLDFLPDFIVYTGETVPDGTWFPTNHALCAGYFDSDWRLSDESLWLSAGRLQ